MNDRDRDFLDAAQVLDESVVVGAVRGAIDYVRRIIQGRRLPAAALKGPLYAVAAVAGVLTHVILLQVIPDRVAPVKPLAYWMVVAFAVFVAVAGFMTRLSKATATADSAAGTANAMKS